jgi:hypothetical protein
VQILPVEDASSTASSLRGIDHSDPIIGGLEALPTHGDVDTDRRDQPVRPGLMGCLERLAKALSDDQGRLIRADIVEEHHELITIHTSGRVANPKRRAKSRRHVGGPCIPSLVDRVDRVESNLLRNLTDRDTSDAGVELADRRAVEFQELEPLHSRARVEDGPIFVAELKSGPGKLI